MSPEVPGEPLKQCIWVFLFPPGELKAIQSFTVFPKINHWGQMLDYLWYESAASFLAMMQEDAEARMVYTQATRMCHPYFCFPPHRCGSS